MEAQKRPKNNDANETTLRGALVLLLMFATPCAHASAMLRCESDDSTVSYVTERIEHARCVRIDMSLQGARPASSPSMADAPRAALPVRRRVAVRMYSYVEDGVSHYLSRKPDNVSESVSVINLYFMETCNLCAPDKDVDIAGLTLNPRSYGTEIDSAATAFDVDRALVRAVIHAESAYRPNAISRAGAQGLMQLMPATAARFNVGDPFDAAQNIRGGVHYLSWLMKHFNGNLDFALAAYNSGEATVDRYNGVPPYAETQAYVSRVKTLVQRYRDER